MTSGDLDLWQFKLKIGRPVLQTSPCGTDRQTDGRTDGLTDSADIAKCNYCKIFHMINPLGQNHRKSFMPTSLFSSSRATNRCYTWRSLDEGCRSTDRKSLQRLRSAHARVHTQQRCESYPRDRLWRHQSVTSQTPGGSCGGHCCDTCRMTFWSHAALLIWIRITRLDCLSVRLSDCRVRALNCRTVKGAVIGVNVPRAGVTGVSVSTVNGQRSAWLWLRTAVYS